MRHNETPIPPRGDSIIVFAPHNDDEILATGGVIQKYVRSDTPVRVALMTNGDGQVRRPPLPPLSRPNFIKLGCRRQKETLDALTGLGLPDTAVEFFGYPDRGIAPMWTSHWSRGNLYRSKHTGSTHSPYQNSYSEKTPYCGSAVVQDVKRILLETQPEVIYLPHPNDLHPDHWATNGFVLYGLEQLKHEGFKAFENVRMMSYLVHSLKYPRPRGKLLDAALTVPAHLAALDTEWRSVALEPNERQLKLQAIKKHKTQTRIMRHYLLSFVRANELFGSVPSVSLDKSAEYKTALNLSGDAFEQEGKDVPLFSYLEPRRKSQLVTLKSHPVLESVGLSKKAGLLTMNVHFSQGCSSNIDMQVSVKPFSPGSAETGESHTYMVQGSRIDHNKYGLPNTDVPRFKRTGGSCRLCIPLKDLGDPCKLILSLTLVRKGVPFARGANRLVRI